MTGPAGIARELLAAARKEWQVQRRYPFQVVPLVLWPAVIPAVYVVQAHAFSDADPAAFQAFAERSGTTQVAGFVYVGWSVYLWLSNILWGPGTALRTQQIQGQLEALLLTPGRRAAVLFGGVPSYLLITVIQFVVVGAALVGVFHAPISGWSALRTLIAVLVSVPVMYGLGAMFAVLVLRIGEVHTYVQFGRGVCAVFCGITFPIVVLPDWARGVAQVLPPTHVITAIRAPLLTGAGLGETTLALVVLAVCGLALCALAAALFVVVEHRGRKMGTLSRY